LPSRTAPVRSTPLQRPIRVVARVYHRKVQQIELWLIVGGALLIVAAVAHRYRATIVRRPLAAAVALGVVPGILGAVVVLVPRTDLIPDQVEPALWVALIVVISGLFMTAIWLGALRR
jgi:hypothetical protein